MKQIDDSSHKDRKLTVEFKYQFIVSTHRAQIRLVNQSDATQILDIYTPHIVNSATSFELVVPTVKEMQSRINECLENYPWLVCTFDQLVVGYAYASRYRSRPAYNWTVEVSVYVLESYGRRNIGRALYIALEQILKLQGYKQMIAVMTSPNPASRGFHEKCGFEHAGTIPSTGYKLDNWHGIDFYYKLIDNTSPFSLLKPADIDTDVLSGFFTTACEQIVQD